jgi:hypothetical protein
MLAKFNTTPTTTAGTQMACSARLGKCTKPPLLMKIGGLNSPEFPEALKRRAKNFTLTLGQSEDRKFLFMFCPHSYKQLTTTAPSYEIYLFINDNQATLRKTVSYLRDLVPAMPFFHILCTDLA